MPRSDLYEVDPDEDTTGWSSSCSSGDFNRCARMDLTCANPIHHITAYVPPAAPKLTRLSNGDVARAAAKAARETGRDAPPRPPQRTTVIPLSRKEREMAQPVPASEEPAEPKLSKRGIYIELVDEQVPPPKPKEKALTNAEAIMKAVKEAEDEGDLKPGHQMRVAIVRNATAAGQLVSKLRKMTAGAYLWDKSGDRVFVTIPEVRDPKFQD